jgi:hypothetical protein
VKWEEVEHALTKKDANLLVFEAKHLLERVQKMGDLFAPVLTLKQKLPKLSGIEERRPRTIESGVELAAQADSGPRGAKKSVNLPRKRSAAKKKARKI